MILHAELPVDKILTGKDIVAYYKEQVGIITNKGNVNHKDTIKDKIKKRDKALNSNLDMLLRLTPSATMERYAALCQKHCRELVAEGYGMSRSAIKKLDTIDLTDMADYQSKERMSMPEFPIMYTQEYVDYVMNNCEKLDSLMCMMVSPFTNFVFKLHRDRYMHVQIEKVAIEDYAMTIIAQDYTAQKSTWVPGTKVKADITLGKPTEEIVLPATQAYKNLFATLRIDLYRDKCFNPHDINHLIDLDKLGFDKTDKELWQFFSENYSKNVMDLLEETGTNSCIELIKYAMMCCCVTNYMLHGNKPKIVREPKTKDKAFPKPTAETADESQAKAPERRVRYIGAVKVTSTSMPREATPERVRHYKVAVWKARGGIRHMKDGRTIPFKESIRYRKKLKDKIPEQELAQTVLKLHDNSNIAFKNTDKSV